MKRVLSAIVVAFFLVSGQSIAQECDTENGFTTTNTIQTPAFFTINEWRGGFIITNVSDIPVLVSLEFTDADGEDYVPYSVSYASRFSQNNSPLELPRGAILDPGQIGEVMINDDNTRLVNVGTLRWRAETCLPHALVVNYRNKNEAQRYENFIRLNNGNPF